MGSKASTANWRTVLRVCGCLRPYPWHVAVAILAFAAAGATVIALGQGVRNLLDVGLRGTPATLAIAAAMLLLLVAVYGASGLGRVYLSGFIADRVATDLRKQLMDRLLGHGAGFFDEHGASMVWSRATSDVDLVAALLGAMVAGLRSIVVVVGGTWAMLATSATLTGAFAALALVVVTSVLWMGRQVRQLWNDSQALSARSNAFALELLEGVKVVKAFCQEQRSASRFAQFAETGFRKADRRNWVQGVIVGSSTSIVFGSAVILAWFAGQQMLHGRLSEGRASAFLFYAVVVAISAGALSELWGQLQKGFVGAEHVFGLIDSVPEIRSPKAPTRLPAVTTPQIRFENVSFRYPMRPDAAVVSDFSWTFKPDTVTAIVGPSGAGKSTLFQLLLRLYDPTGGAILFDDVDIRQVDPQTLRSRISLVPQDPTLFEGTVFDNIRFGREDATADEVVAAATGANAMEFIRHLPQGLETDVGARGAQLSGGQRQRVAIARAILRDPQILLLDEATNALDATSEALIRNALDKFSAGRTTLVIAHKLATVREADSILVLEHGRLVSHGAHAKLLAEDGLYATFAALQLL